MTESQATATGLTQHQQALNDLWDQHIREEFADIKREVAGDRFLAD